MRKQGGVELVVDRISFGDEIGEGLAEGGGFVRVGQQGEVDEHHELGGVDGGVGVDGGDAQVGDEELIGLVEHDGAVFQDIEGEAGDGLGYADGGDDGGEIVGMLLAVGLGEFEEGGEGFVGGDVLGDEFLEHGGGSVETGQSAPRLGIVCGKGLLADGVFHGHGGEGGGEGSDERGDGAAAGGGGFGGGGGKEVLDGHLRKVIHEGSFHELEHIGYIAAGGLPNTAEQFFRP